MISYEDFKKIELKVAKIISAERIKGSEKLLKLMIDVGDPSASSGQARQLVAGIGKCYESETLVGREIIIVANLETRKLMGVESQGMLLAADSEEGPVLLTVLGEVKPGSHIK